MWQLKNTCNIGGHLALYILLGSECCVIELPTQGNTQCLFHKCFDDPNGRYFRLVSQAAVRFEPQERGAVLCR